ncbi:MAG: GAF domain-containing protein [Pseudonocardia sp.]
MNVPQQFDNRTRSDIVRTQRPVVYRRPQKTRLVQERRLPGRQREPVQPCRGGLTDGTRVRLRGSDGRHRWVLDRGAPDRCDGYVGGCLDIDTRHRDRERQRLLAVISSAMDRETTVQARREVLVRTLVDEGVVDLARLVEIHEDGRDGVRAVAGHTIEAEDLMRALHGGWADARSALASGEPRLVEVDERYHIESSADPEQRAMRRRLNMLTVVLVPLATRGRVVGLLAAARTVGSRPQDTEDLELLTEIGQRAATALDNALLLEREQDSARRLDLIQKATAALSAAATPVQVAQAAMRHGSALLGCPDARWPTPSSAACSRPPCPCWTGSGWPPATSRRRGAARPAVTGTTCWPWTTSGWRSSSATSWGRGPRRPR